MINISDDDKSVGIKLCSSSCTTLLLIRYMSSSLLSVRESTKVILNQFLDFRT